MQSAVSTFRDFKIYFSAKALLSSSEEKQRDILGFYMNFVSIVLKKNWLEIKIELRIIFRSYPGSAARRELL